MIEREFNYWELLFLVFISTISGGMGVAFNKPLLGTIGIVFFYLMWMTAKKVGCEK